MAAEARREARRKRILENSDSRLQRILDNTSTDSTNLEEDKIVTGIKTQSETSLPKGEIQEVAITTTTSEQRDEATPTADEVQTDQPNVDKTIQSAVEKKDTEIKETVPCQSEKVEHIKSTSYGPWVPWVRVVLNVSLALLLVVLSAAYKVHQNFTGPWLVLQLTMFYFTSSQQGAAWVSVQVALQLSGISSRIAKAINTIYIFLITVFTDIPVFIFGVVFWVEIVRKSGVDLSHLQ